MNHIGFTYFNISKHAEAILVHEEARRLLEDCGDLAGFAESLHGLGENSSFLGRFQEAIPWLQESVKVSEQLGNRSLAGENRYMYAWVRGNLGEYAEAQREAERSVAVLAEIGDVWNLAWALAVAAFIAVTLGEFAKALDYTTRGLGLARQIAAGRPAGFCLLRRGTLYREMEDHHSAWESDREAADLARAGEFSAFIAPLVLSSLALDAAALGQPDHAQARIEEARRVIAEGPDRFDFRQEVTHAEGRVLLALGRPAQVLEAAKALLEKVAATHTLHWRIPAMLLLADATAALGDPAVAVPVYEAAAEEAERLGLTPALWRALAGLAEAQRTLGRAQESAASAGRAREIIDRLAATVPDERLRATFLQSAKVQRVAALAGA